VAGRNKKITVVVSREARKDLDEIYLYNVEQRGLVAADRYLSKLTRAIEELGSRKRGRPVDLRPDLSYFVCRKRPKTDGHVVVFLLDEEGRFVRVLHVFHTKQDWQNKLD
jgi:plasmid stabilization system protein ParE